ncbi:MAG: histidine kinase, partial [Salinibacterium sp.]|nr:histidine kinase [Salinibacterium sp.]
MELIAKERDRLLQRSARFIGLGSTAVALVCFSVPGVLHLTTLLSALPLFIMLSVSLYRVGVNQSLIWIVLGMLSGLGILVIVQLPGESQASPSLGTAIVPLAAGAIASFAVVLTSSIGRIILLVVGFIATVVLAELAIPGTVSVQDAEIVTGWVLAAVFGSWLSASIPRAARRIYSI